MTEMIIQLREYEEGRYGLKEAREEIQVFFILTTKLTVISFIKFNLLKK